MFTIPECQRVRRDAGRPQASGQLVGEHDIRELGLVVGGGARARVGPLALEVVEVDPSQRLGVEATVTTRAGALRIQPIDEQAGEQKGARWFRANICSRPSTVTRRVFQ